MMQNFMTRDQQTPRILAASTLPSVTLGSDICGPFGCHRRRQTREWKGSDIEFLPTFHWAKLVTRPSPSRG
jgi:hypothetical protein